MNLNALRHANITGTGRYVPEKVITNAYLESLVDTSDEWIRQRTGIVERRMAAPDQATSDLCFEASKIAIADAGLKPEDIDQIIVATVTPDTMFPATACRLQHALGCRQVPSFDLTAACSGYIYALSVARTAIAAGTAEHILVVGAETLTRITDYTDRSTCILFGDGAGAAVLSAVSDAERGIIETHLAADGAGADLMILPSSGSRLPTSPEVIEQHLQYIKLNGRAVYKNAIAKIVMLVNESLARHGLTSDDIKLIIPHQMNARIIESAAKHLGIPLEKVFVDLDIYGNTSAATIPMALDHARREGRFVKGDLICLVAFGGGMTWASALIRW
ncbi:MAG: ketoacyl-ACP synthase III [Planctomycetota bacterium]|jgi:3-oxoacyl-[acyl-carrier-protein] synthase-3|nr:ketoacyl-ACP synthase III [Planctomycetota bacterium]